METSSLILIGILIPYLILCNEVGMVAKKKGLKFLPVFLFSAFATPVGGLLYSLLLLHKSE